MSGSRAVLVLSGYNIRAVVAFCRWATANQINFHIIARDGDDPIFMTDYRHRVLVTRNSPKLETGTFHSWVDDLGDQYGYERIVLLPTTEYLNRFALAHRAELERDEALVIPLVDEQLYTAISDKHSFAGLCESNGLEIPAELPAMPESFPFVAKPRSYASAGGRQLVPYLVLNAADRERFADTEAVSDFFFQQYVGGRSFYLLAYLGAEKDAVLFSQENLMQQARGGSVILARASTFHRTEASDQCVAMLRDIGFRGLIMVEFKLDVSSGRHYMIEANPRLWGPLQFAVDNGVGLLRGLLGDYGFAVPAPGPANEQVSYYYWSGGITPKSKPISYHNYSPKKFADELSSIRPSDLFRRSDTMDLYLQESQLSQPHDA